MKQYISSLQSALKDQANAKTKAWFDNYLKGAIAYYGVKTPCVKKIVKQWRATHQLGLLPPDDQLRLCRELMSLSYAEEKFAAILYLQEYLVDVTATKTLLDTAEWFYEKGCFFDWSTADWFTVRVLAKIIDKDIDSLSRIQSWRRAPSVWQRRASIVALRRVANQERHIALLKETVGCLVVDSERFIQTGIGWTLSDLSKQFPHEAQEIVECYFDQLSAEVIDRHTKYMPQHADYKKRKRAKKS